MIWWIIFGVLLTLAAQSAWRVWKSPEAPKGPSASDPEVQYYDDIESFVRSVGSYDRLLELQGTDEEYCAEVFRVQKAAYLNGIAVPVAAALILDSAKHYVKNRGFALAFLEHLETQWNAKARGINGPTRPATPETQDEAENWHPALDDAEAQVRKFITERLSSDPSTSRDDLTVNPMTELVVFAATYLAKRRSESSVHPGCWNTFSAAIENRMLSKKDDGSERSVVIDTPSGPAFGHFGSTYLSEMENIENIADADVSVRSQDVMQLPGHLLRLLGASAEHAGEFEIFLNGLVEFAAKRILPKVELALS